MMTRLQLHEGTVRPGLVAELEALRAPGQRVSSYYLDFGVAHGVDAEAAKLTVKNALARQRERLDQLDLPPAIRHALRHEWELVQELALTTAGQRAARALACFVASGAGYARALRLPWPVRDRAFFEDRFVLWPLYQVLDQADRYGIILTDKDDARLFLFFLERIEEVADVFDALPGRVRFPDPFGELEYMRKHVEQFHHHFERVAEGLLRLFQREPFERLIIGGLWETLPQFEGHLHHSLRERIVARWEIDVRTPTSQLLERVREAEQHMLRQQAQALWTTIQNNRTQRGALGPEETFAALWQRRVQALLLEPEVHCEGFRCWSCARLHFSSGPCVECGGKMAQVADIYDEAVREAIAQSAQVRFWKDPALNEVDSIAALKRF